MNRAVENDPHWNTTHGVDGCFAAMLFVVTSQHENSASTFFSTELLVGSSDESRKISTVISRGSGPMNSGREPSRTAAVGVVFHRARRLSESVEGLKSKLNVLINPPGVVLRPMGGS